MSKTRFITLAWSWSETIPHNTLFCSSTSLPSRLSKRFQQTRAISTSSLSSSSRCKSLKPIINQRLRKMQSTNSSDHLTRTSSNTRNEGIHAVIVKSINSLSPTIKEVVLTPETIPAPFTFKAGQWVDVFIPNVDTVGGFSMFSSPQELQRYNQLRLAIKYSTHPPALWMHEKCQVGDKLDVRVGGDFYLTFGNETACERILLIAGGVGINPLSSMIHYAMNDKILFPPGSRMCLLYSAKATNELVFQEDFDKYSESNHDFTVKYFITEKVLSSPSTSIGASDSIHSGRISKSNLLSAAKWLGGESDGTGPSNYDDVKAFICGPPSMISDFTDQLRTLGIRAIHYEKWW